MVLQKIIDRYKTRRKNSYLDSLDGYKYKYAFIGTGYHSISNLYPCLENINLPLRYIFSKQIGNAKQLSKRFPGCKGTDSFEEILNDPDVKGLFISIKPSLHFEFLKGALQARKHVFIEKPLCENSHDLSELIRIQENLVCVPGLQKRFGLINQSLKKFNLQKRTISYTYRYCTGSYPEGNPIYELFIHPVDNIIQLFGRPRSFTIQSSKKQSGITYQLLIIHESGINGVIELSTNYSWKEPVDEMIINLDNETLNVNYPNQLVGTEKLTSIAGIPLEKIRQQPVIKKIYFDNKQFSSMLETNNLAIQGFYPELKHFVSLVEGSKNDNFGKLETLKATYDLLDKLAAS
jgi:virulence factor